MRIVLAACRRVCPRLPRAVAGVVLLVSSVAACGMTPASNPSGGRIPVVAAENFWGSIATQLGGDRVSVTSVITNPGTDPHGYEPRPEDGRSIAQARYVILNGAGYDAWVRRLLEANPAAGRSALTVADVAGRKEGDNPHLWYSPDAVGKVIQRITADYKRLDPAGAAYFDQQNTRFTTEGLNRYDTLRSVIRATHGGAPVGSTESVFADLAHELGLNLITPPEYMRAISEGGDPSAAAKNAMDSQISHGEIQVLVFNRQNSTPDIQAVVDRARRQGVPVVAITETLDPPSATFQDWQVAQLRELRSALSRPARG